MEDSYVLMMPDIYLDTADIGKIRSLKRTGLIQGVTTNPVLIRKYLDANKADLADYQTKLFRVIGKIPVFVQPVADTMEKFVSEALDLWKTYAKNSHIVIKVPLWMPGGDYDGLTAMRELKKRGIRINASAIVSSEQAFMAARTGADYVALFTGNLDDYIREQSGVAFDKFTYLGEEESKKFVGDKGISCGKDLVAKVISLFQKFSLKNQIVVAGIRNSQALRDYLSEDVSIITTPPKVIEEIIKHPKTLEFVNDCIRAGRWF